MDRNYKTGNFIKQILKQTKLKDGSINPTMKKPQHWQSSTADY